MKISMAFLRIFFVFLSILFMTTFMVALPVGPLWQKIFIGLGVGFVFSILLIGFEQLIKRYNLRALNTVILGLFVGYLLGQALNVIFQAIIDLTHLKLALQPQTIGLLKVSIFLFGTYMGAFMTLRFSDEFHLSIPFVKFAPTSQRKKDLILDESLLSDPRIIDLSATGIFDHQLIVPSFLVKNLQAQLEMGDEHVKSKARRSLETIKKLEDLPNLAIKYNESDFPETTERFSKLIRLARLLDANILTADISQVQMPVIEGIKVLNMHALSNALKPLMESGETMNIKIQRYGKEPNQGVGYLDDGTMVVVNGGGDFIGETIEVNVLSVKHTSSGRMIFCNAFEDIPSKGNRAEV